MIFFKYFIFSNIFFNFFPTIWFIMIGDKPVPGLLKVKSDYGTYNNKTLDMFFNSNVKANYQNSVLFAENAEYSNSENFLSISGKVKIEDFKGTMFADKLLFDIKKHKLNITSFNDDKINANLNLK